MYTQLKFLSLIALCLNAHTRAPSLWLSSPKLARAMNPRTLSANRGDEGSDSEEGAHEAATEQLETRGCVCECVCVCTCVCVCVRVCVCRLCYSLLFCFHFFSLLFFDLYAHPSSQLSVISSLLFHLFRPSHLFLHKLTHTNALLGLLLL